MAMLQNTVEKIKRLESQFDHLFLNRARKLAKDHEPQTAISPWHYHVGRTIAAIFAIGCGVTGVAAMAASVTFGGLPFYAMVAILGFAGPLANWEMTKKDVPKILSLGFINLFKTEGPTLSLEGVELIHGITEDDIKRYIVAEFKKQDVIFDITDFNVTKNKKNPNKIDLSFVTPQTHKAVSVAIMSDLKQLLQAKSFHIEPSKFIPLRKRLLLGFTAFLSAGFGVAIGALTYASVLGLPAKFAFFGAAFSAVGLAPVLTGTFVVIGAIIGTVTFMCLTALMVKTFADAIKVPNLGLKISNLFAKRENESTLGHGLRVAAIAVLGGGALLLSAYGVSTMLASCNTGFAAILNQIPGAYAPAVTIASTIITQCVAFVAQVPFMIKTSFGTIAGAINRFSFPKALETVAEKTATKAQEMKDNPKTYALVKQLAAGALSITSKSLYISAFVFNAVSNGFLSIHGSMQDAGLTAWTIIAGIGGAINSFFATFGNAIAGNTTPEPEAAKPGATLLSSTAAIKSQIISTNGEATKPLLTTAANDHIVVTDYGSFRNNPHTHGTFGIESGSDEEQIAYGARSPMRYNRIN